MQTYNSDLGVGSINVVYNRNKMVDFSTTAYQKEFSLFSRKPIPKSPVYNIIYPFQSLVWLGLCKIAFASFELLKQVVFFRFFCFTDNPCLLDFDQGIQNSAWIEQLRLWGNTYKHFKVLVVILQIGDNAFYTGNFPGHFWTDLSRTKNSMVSVHVSIYWSDNHVWILGFCWSIGCPWLFE